MKVESVKTVLLFFLVGISLVLTWNLWTYQPAYDVVDNTQFLQDVVTTEERKLEEHIIPSKIVYHHSSHIVGSTEDENVKSFMEDMKKWGFSKVRPMNTALFEEDFLSFVHDRDGIEVMYPDRISFKVFQLMFQVKEQSVPNAYFDRILFSLKNQQSQFVTAYFIDYDKRRVFEATVENFNKATFQQLKAELKSTYKPYVSYDIKDVRKIFLPKEPQKLNHVQYYIDTIEVEKFWKALFNSTEYVKKESLMNRDLYTDGPRVLDVNTQTNMIEYTSLVNSNTEGPENNNLLNRSFTFMNDHGGWIDKSYRFASWNPNTREIIYRFHEKNYPVFNSQGLTEIYQRWGSMELLNYKRSLYRVVKFPLDSYQVTLSSGEEIIEFIEKKHPNFQKELLEDLVVGYSFVKGESVEGNEEVNETLNLTNISLEPAWFYVYDKKWFQVIMEKELGGKADGLE
ncbi:YycH family regulatory protein [Metabacillus iocasae]|uniref:Regulatory protein YycH of two-component signal transduction system YycFG n=1 Tax=Priestia iocasae TaxID=2291674 RepID=A0ABS2QYY3_9BACI|nr:two-component system activity regulator YycH [Metabacillus iocasae]MBM7704197.1 regulatory protein YycH of two-component signal transduction system YycFG [Metabacillus iocasae]